MKDIIDNVIEKKINDMKTGENIYEVGQVISINSYIIEVSGLDNAGFYEKILIGDKAEGYISSINTRSVTVALMLQSAPINIGDEAISTGKEYYAHYSQDSIGCIVDMLGNDKLKNKKFSDLDEIEMETEAMPLMDRTTVERPMLTGIAGIDLLYPVGKGQRQLIIGDKKTGKTQIALDTIVNQNDKNVFCIYVALGKTKKEVKDIYNDLEKRGAMGYTLILAAFNDDTPPILRNTPYVAMSIAESYMAKGFDSLVIIDDLKRHADCIREMSLLMGKVPGRDAYPPDIFFSHSSMLEKGCQHNNGGSVTVLPIVETKGGDITDYISTNIISITDGQIVLSAKNFAKGQKPAIDYGLSVSRLGGAVQEKSVKGVGAKVRRQLLSYLETREVYELANMDEMSDEMKRKMTDGKEIIDHFNQYKYAVRTSDEIITTFKRYVR